MEKTNKVPRLRFPGFTDDWEQRKLGELVQFSKGTGYSKSDLKNSGTPIILYGRLYTKYETVISQVDTFADAKKGSVYSHGGEVIVPASGETAEDISIASVVEQPGVILGGDLNIITPPKELDSAFLALCISNGQPHSDMAKVAQGKTVVHLHNDDLKTVNLIYPKTAEQKQISQFFGAIDNLITLHQRKLNAVKQHKTGMLQKMFPRDGDNVPEVRFPGFTDTWEQRKLGDVLTERNVQHPQSKEFPLVSFTVENGVTPKTDRYEREQLVKGDKAAKKYKETHFNDIVYNPANLKFGAIARNKYGNAVFSPIYVTYEVNDELALPSFVEMYVTRKSFIQNALQYQQGTVYERMAVNTDDFANLEIMIPSKEEQSQIGKLFTSLDDFITLHQRKLDQMKQYKKGLLQQMFV